MLSTLTGVYGKNFLATCKLGQVFYRDEQAVAFESILLEFVEFLSVLCYWFREQMHRSIMMKATGLLSRVVLLHNVLLEEWHVYLSKKTPRGVWKGENKEGKGCSVHCL